MLLSVFEQSFRLKLEVHSYGLCNAEHPAQLDRNQVGPVIRLLDQQNALLLLPTDRTLMILTCHSKSNRRIQALACVWIALVAWGALDKSSQSGTLRADERIEFERDIRPILQDHCAECHNQDESNGGLSLDSRAGAFAQTDSGKPAIKGSTPDESELLVRVQALNEDTRMPPDGERLSDAEIQLLTQWIAEGAAWPETHDSQSTKPDFSHWAYQQYTAPEIPPVDTRAPEWPYGAIDHFIQAQRASAGLQVVPDAEPLTLLRRATYGLTGLPPTPAEAAQFLENIAQDGKSYAYIQLVDDLLNRRSYGERWGRHWMDWVRYADTAGDNSDFPIPQAYLYRNYIIDSLNADVPYDRFLTEQIAGDLLPAADQEQRNQQNIATGYLAMARRFGSLVERYPWHLTIEDTIDNIGRTTMGLTLACARCHDHKFDPISTRDYYGLYGIFASTRFPFPGIELLQAQKDMVPLLSDEEAAKHLEPYEEETQKLESALLRLLHLCEERALQNAEREGAATLDEQRKMQDELDAMLIKARNAGTQLAKHLKTIPEFPTAYAVQDGTPQSARIQIKGEPTKPGAEVPRHFPEVLGGQQLSDEAARSSSGRLELAQWITDSKNPLTARVIVNRVWQRHFGVGLVPSTSDFGIRGEQPTHPELLDWLATEFVRNGWSLKQLHRLILLSHTYQLSSQDVTANLASDPGNRFYWKFNRQRLDAESIRDSLLMFSGALDPSPQTEPYPIPPQAKWGYTQHHPFKDDYGTNKRSVYMMTKRLTAQTYFQTFDGADPNVCTSSRDESVTPLQALYFVNDEFLHEQAKLFARNLVESELEQAAMAQRAFASILCRQPTDDELRLVLDHVAETAARVEGSASTGDGKSVEALEVWTSVTRSLLRLNEFLYVD